MAEYESWDTSKIHREINSQKHTDHELVPLSDVEKLVASEFLLCSWGGSGIRFRREDHQGLYIELGKAGYFLGIQYASRKLYHRYNLTACEDFFRGKSIKMNDATNWREIHTIHSDAGNCGQIHTQDLPLDDAIILYKEFESNRETLKWDK